MSWNEADEVNQRQDVDKHQIRRFLAAKGERIELMFTSAQPFGEKHAR